MDESKRRGASRRGFLSTAMMLLSLIASYGTAAVYALGFLYPRRQTKKRSRIYITSTAQLKRDGEKVFYDLQGKEVVLIESEDGYRAISTNCTHLGCRVRWEPENNRFFCPCHDGVFDVNGNVVSGPPPRALDRYPVVAESGSIYVEMEA